MLPLWHLLLLLLEINVSLQGEPEVRQINGHSSEEEKEEEGKEPWPDDHSSSRYTRTEFVFIKQSRNWTHTTWNLGVRWKIDRLKKTKNPPLLLQRLFQWLFWLDGRRRDQPWAAKKERESEEEKQWLRGGWGQEEGREERKKEGEGGQRRHVTKEEEAKGEEQGWSLRKFYSSIISGF